MGLAWDAIAVVGVIAVVDGLGVGECKIKWLMKNFIDCNKNFEFLKVGYVLADLMLVRKIKTAL